MNLRPFNLLYVNASFFLYVSEGAKKNKKKNKKKPRTFAVMK